MLQGPLRTDGDVVRVVRFQQTIEMSPDFRQPADDAVHTGRHLIVVSQLCRDQSPAQIAAE